MIRIWLVIGLLFSVAVSSAQTFDVDELQELLEKLKQGPEDDEPVEQEYEYEKPTADYISDDDTLFSEEHQAYLLEDQQLAPFDREYYNRLIEAMVLKSRGEIVLDMDEIDPNFNPDDYIMDDEYREYHYSEGDGSYVEDWNEYYYDDYRQYQRYEKEDHYEVKRIEKEREQQLGQNSRFNKSKPKGSGWSVVLLIVMAVVLAGIVVYLFIQSPRDTEIKKSEIDDLAPTEIPKSELEIMLEKALAEEDYRKAIRIYFIFTMKDLSEKGWIVWQKKKTNALYLREMKDKPHFDEFYQVVSIYEVAWYGKREINKTDFQSVEPTLKQLLNHLERHQ